MAIPLKIAVQMDPIHGIDINGDSTFALMLEAQARGHRLWLYDVRAMSLREGKAAPGDRAHRAPHRTRPPGHGAAHRRRPRDAGRRGSARPFFRRRGADAPGPALRHGLHHRHPHAGARPQARRQRHAGGERSPLGARRAGKAAGDALPRPDAAHPDLVGPPGDPRLPRRAPRHHRQAAVRQRRLGRVPHPCRRPEPRLAAGNVLFRVARAAHDPALRARRACRRQAHHPGRWRADRRHQPRPGGGRGAFQHARGRRRRAGRA